ncbi:hypothetical protein CHU98_g7476 [Xylaria longipes]|nr:hypothetical protein CHU98_g7476 [Xylaria longipes]
MATQYVLDPDGDVMIILRNFNAPFAVLPEDGNLYVSTLPPIAPPSESPPRRSMAKKKKKYKMAQPQPAQLIPAEAQPEVTPEESLPLESMIEAGLEPEPVAEESPLESMIEAQAELVAEEPPSEQTSEEPVEPKIHLQVSSAHLRLASSYFREALDGPFKESHRASNGFRYVDAEDWDKEALLIVMRIIHGQNRHVPRHLSLEMLAKVGVIVDYYQCREVLGAFVDIWCLGMKSNPLPLSLDRDLIMLLFVSWVFHWGDQFRSVTKLMQDDCTSLDKWRQESIDQITDALNDLLKYFGKEAAECSSSSNYSFECSSMLLGALTRELRYNKQLSFTELARQNYTGYSVVSATAATRGIRTPRWRHETPYHGGYGYGYSPSRHECNLDEIVGAKMDLVRKAEGLRLDEFVQIA